MTDKIEFPEMNVNEPFCKFNDIEDEFNFLLTFPLNAC